ncbi:MAG: hypothetical protein ACREV6_05955 [Clostridium sp.]|uniref:hypothetical protein n=1 Tax=Clostridium sp. TaxID=1506 RepID=UPI003D6D5DC4
MIPVASYQIVEFLEWINKYDDINKLETFKLEELTVRANEYLTIKKQLVIKYSSSLELFLLLFQTCVPLSCVGISEQMELFSSNEYELELEKKQLSDIVHIKLHPFLNGFLKYSNKSGLSSVIKEKIQLNNISFTDEKFDENFVIRWINVLNKAVGNKILDEFQRYLAISNWESILNYEKNRSKWTHSRVSRCIKRDMHNYFNDNYTEPIYQYINIDSEARRLADTVLYVISSGYKIKEFEQSEDSFKYSVLEDIGIQPLAYSFEFIEWISKTYTQINISGDIPSDKLSELIIVFCNTFGYKNQVKFAKQLQMCLRGEGDPSVVHRLISAIKGNSKTNFNGDSVTRYRTVPFHGIFIFDIYKNLKEFKDEYWQLINSLTSDYIDVYYSVDDFKHRVSAFEIINSINSFKNIPYNLIPCLIIWGDNIKNNNIIPLNDLKSFDIYVLFKNIVQYIREDNDLGGIASKSELWIKKYLDSDPKIQVNANEFYVNNGQALNMGPNSQAYNNRIEKNNSDI